MPVPHATDTPILLLLGPNDEVPNNPRLAALHYPGAVTVDGSDPARRFERLFARHGWTGSWRNGIFAYHHFHSTAHEVLGIYSGEATVRLGGEPGRDLRLAPGDVVVIPAGVAHKKLAHSGRLGVVGAYPRGQCPDLCKPERRRLAQRALAVARVPQPRADPVFGPDGPLLEHWTS